MASQRTIHRGGVYYRVAAPDWTDPANTDFSKQRGGRWNPAGEFGALYLAATIQVAAANARAQHRGRAIKLFDLLPPARPDIVIFDVAQLIVLDACTLKGIKALGFAENFPFEVTWLPCQQAARKAHAAGLPGAASRSAAEVTATACAGEELALFEEAVAGTASLQARRAFKDWYPDPIPG